MCKKKKKKKNQLKCFLYEDSFDKDLVSAGWQSRVSVLFPPSHSFRNERVKASGKLGSCDPEEVGVSTSSQLPCLAQLSAEDVLECWSGEGW